MVQPIKITNSLGEEELFSERKVLRSLKRTGVSSLIAKIESMLEERKKYYSIANYEIQCGHNIGLTVDKIIKIVQSESWK